MTGMFAMRAAMSEYSQVLDMMSLSSQRASHIERDMQLEASEDEADAMEHAADLRLGAALAGSAQKLANGFEAAHDIVTRQQDQSRPAPSTEAEVADAAERASLERTHKQTMASINGIVDSSSAAINHFASSADADAKRASARAGMHGSLSSDAREDASRYARLQEKVMSNLQEIERARQQQLLSVARRG